MLISETKLRVRYADTDKMGYVYHGTYAQYYEVGRTEMIRELGLPYSKMEEEGVMMPVLSLNIKYIKPATYDELLTIRTIVKKKPVARIDFEYEVFNENNELLNTGTTTLVFVDEKSRKPRRAPDFFMEKIETFF